MQLQNLWWVRVEYTFEGVEYLSKEEREEIKVEKVQVEIFGILESRCLIESLLKSYKTKKRILSGRYLSKYRK